MGECLEAAVTRVGGRIAIVALATGFAMTAKSASGQSGAEMDRAATEMSAAIQKAAGDRDARVLVLDFTGPKGRLTELGLRLADDLADSLTKQPTGITVVDRQALHDAIARNKVMAADLQRVEAATCYAHELDATVIITGRLEISAGDYDLELTASRTGKHKDKILEEAVKDKLTDEEKALADANAFFSSRPGVGTTDPDPGAPAGGTGGYSIPTCVRCPQPDFSAEAVKATFQGTILLMVQIDLDGRASHVRLIKGLGCGLNEKAVKAVSGWRFKPAMGPDGRPAAVTVPIEIVFRLY